MFSVIPGKLVTKAALSLNGDEASLVLKAKLTFAVETFWNIFGFIADF